MTNVKQSRFFQLVDWIAKVQLSQVYVVMIPLILTTVWGMIFWVNASIWVQLPVVLIGVFGWTFFEYLIHRYIFHNQSKLKWVQKLVFLIHGYHHKEPNDKLRLLFPGIISLPVHILIFFLSYASLSLIGLPDLRFAFSTGFFIGYFAFELIHYQVHSSTLRFWYFRKIQKHHLDHHYKDAHNGFGFTTTFWDKVFNTGK